MRIYIRVKNKGAVRHAPFCFNLRFAQWPSKAEEAAVHDEIVDLMERGVLKSMDYISDMNLLKTMAEEVVVREVIYCE